jgi:DNA-binding NtrC family response regulator
MSMRGSPRRERERVEVGRGNFAWGRACIATLRHSTLPFPDDASLSATPLAALRDLGGRDRLSLIGQFAAHQAFLQFAGVADDDVLAEEWLVMRKRGVDCRLVRIAAREVDASLTPPVLALAQQFAELIGAELDALSQSWCRAEAIYQEAHARLLEDVAADLRWFRRAAVGQVLSPGPEALRSATTGTFEYSDPACVDSFRALDAVVLEGAGPFPPYAALRAAGAFKGAESEVAEQIGERFAGRTFVIAKPELFDAPSHAVVQMLRTAGTGAWIVPGSGLPDTQHFVLSPNLSARRALDERLTPRFDESPTFDRYIQLGELPPDEMPFAALPEPRRSYTGALALLGVRVPRQLATRFLETFLFREALETLVIPELTSVDDDAYVFASEAIRAQAERLVPAASRAALCRVALEMTDGVRAALLAIDAGDVARAAAILDEVTWSDPNETIATLRALPASALSPRTARAYADALIAAGRYRDARGLAPLLDEGDRELVLAKSERRTGDYAPALARLERLQTRGFEAELLRAELLRLHGRYDEAAAALTGCAPDDPVRLGYERAVIALDARKAVDESWMRGDHYLGARFRTYRALEDERYDDAAALALESFALARGIAERIDSWLDRLHATFSGGRWQEARTIAMQALAEVEETQGDRAAAAILFTLAYLAADEGQWTHAAQRIAQLRRFYSHTRDERQLRELALLAANLELSRGRFEDARREATAMVAGGRGHEQIVEAAALIADELDRIEGRKSPLRSTGRSGNAELTRRHEALEHATEPLDDGTRSRKLQRFRWALATGRRALAEELSRELGVQLDPPPQPGSIELRILHAGATREFPFANHDFEIPWSFATRNRLGHWTAIGPQAVTTASLDVIAREPERDWTACSDRELLFFAGSHAWSDDSRDAIASIFRVRAENHRLRRVIEQDDSAAPLVAAVEGIVGQSAAMRDVYALISRIARRDVAVCILGESGTGKELIARAIHRQSARKSKTFTAVNCAALPENLIESELFGHVRGAFTGADRDRPGLIETTDGGTLFLDEIGEMPVTAQAKLLRFLQEGEFRRVGDSANRTADVRIVSATNRKLEAAVENGRFREDLYYRVRGVEVVLPPLRERAGDIALLANHFVAAERDRHRGGPARLSPDAEAVFFAYGWPGNVRELQNTIRAAHAMAADAKQLDIEHLPGRLRAVIPARTTAGSYQDAVARFKRDLIEKSLLEARGNQNQCATLLKISRQALAYQIRELGIMVKKPRGLT